MPLHDWTRVPAGLFHDFHQSWCVRIKDALNAGRLPKGTIALVERRSGPREPDVLAIEARSGRGRSDAEAAGAAVMEPPITQIVQRSDKEIYAGRSNRIIIRHHLGRIVAVIEILSPGNKDTRAALRDFVDKAVQCLRGGIHILVVNVFPPTPRDPQGIHQAIWDEVGSEPFEFPSGKDRILVSYEAGADRIAYFEALAVRDALRDMPLFLASGLHVSVPLESTYLATWAATPEEFRVAVETGSMPMTEGD